MPRRKPEEINSWKTSDGTIHHNWSEAQKRQEELDLCAFIMENNICESTAMCLAKYMIAQQSELFEILGYDPRDC